MYTKEFKERFLADFYESGLTQRGFCRSRPDAPVPSSLLKWIRQHERGELDVPVREIRGRAERPKHRRYDEATKKEARRLYAKGMRLCDIARRLNVTSGGVIASWLPKDEGGRARIAPKGATRMSEDDKRKIGELEQRIEELVMRERVLLELMRDPKAGSPENLSNRQKIVLGERPRRDFGYSQKQVRTFFGMPRSTYAYGLRALLRDTSRAELVAGNVRAAFEESGRTYGYRRVKAAMEAWDVPFRASEREVRRAMREGRMVPRRTRKGERYSSYAGEPDERPANLPLRDDGTHDFSARSSLTNLPTVDSLTSAWHSAWSLSQTLRAVWRCLRQFLESSSSHCRMIGLYGSSLLAWAFFRGGRGEKSSCLKYL